MAPSETEPRFWNPWLALRPSALLWIQVVEGLLAFLFVGVYTASQSPLGRYLSAGESPLFVWLRTHAAPLFWAGLGVLLVICAVRLWGAERRPVLIQALILVEVAGLGAMAFASLRGERRQL